MKIMRRPTIRTATIAGIVGLTALMAMKPAFAQSNIVVDQAKAALPADIRAAGVLKVATSLQWPPFDYLKDGKPEGIDIRLIKLLAEKLGLQAQFNDLKFPAIVPGVVTGRFDIGVDQIGVTAARLQVVDLVPYFDSAYGLMIRKGAPALDINNLCGKSLVITQGSAQVDMAKQLSAQCAAAGHAPIALIYFPDSAVTYLALSNGRGDGFLTARAVGVYIVQSSDKLAMASGTLAGNLSMAGIVVSKGNAALEKALTLAIESAMDDGSYRKIMADFGVPEGAISKAQLRAPAQP
ncbi:transporter substrate-binding domain-containing protein [Acidisoma silvae]|uniref:Transporter substrate-binding domain-containing protein n=1 Tax=Acidisoma silvae TaxID=2802396 RepID=A0A964E1B6_9PROT|nr:transporter substrate-binding domain-containing protein [Acidisoma silvae]MCB8878057.1 transporter substrate-binding domain-containing protein [Acidisoma silvae]